MTSVDGDSVSTNDRHTDDHGWPGQLDVHLFNEGRHRRLWELLGAHVVDDAQPDLGVRFTVWAPNAREVYAVGDWNHWGDGTRMEPVGSSGIWLGVEPA